MYLCLITYVVLFCSTGLYYKTIKNPAVCFNGWWLILLIISVIGTQGIDKPDNYIYHIFLIGGLSFNIVFVLSSFIKMNNRRQVEEKFDYSIPLSRRKLILIIELLILLYYVYKSIYVIQKISIGAFSYDNIRRFYYSDAYFQNNLEYLVVNYIIDPLILVSEIIFALNLFKKSFGNLTSTIILINIIVRAVISGGRMYLLELAFIILICFLQFRKGMVASRKGRKKIILIGLLLVGIAIVSVAITTGRGREGSFFKKIADALVLNFTGSFSYLNVLESRNLIFNDSLLSSTIAGFIDPFVSILRFLGVTDTLTRQIAIGNITSEFVLIGTQSYNAMPTMYYYFLYDFGMVGVVIGPAFLALISSIIYRKKMRTRRVDYFVAYILLMLLIFESPMNWLLFKSSFALAFIYATILLRKGKVKNENYICCYSKL